MNYNLYSDAGHSSVWGNSAGSWVSGTGAGMGTPQALTVYGRVAGGQANLAAATYTEAAITVNVTF
jgi:spore coat protein U-like protein